MQDIIKAIEKKEILGESDLAARHSHNCEVPFVRFIESFCTEMFLGETI
jgi:hypothetical protein